MLAAKGLAGGDRLLTLYGGMDTQEREHIKAAFQAEPSVSPVRILLATDAASEGIDLQNHCARLVHYEIPWNPNRMEQRNGRIDRHGQKAAEVRIYHFVGQGYNARQAGHGNAYDTLRALGDAVTLRSAVYLWPFEQRGKDASGKAGVLHVKCAVADSRWLFLSSANLTEYTFTVNMKLGVLISGGPLPDQVETHFDQLVQAGLLARV